MVSVVVDYSGSVIKTHRYNMELCYVRLITITWSSAVRLITITWSSAMSDSSL